LIGGSRPVELWSSDLQRAAQTAEPIATRLARPVTHTADLRELSYGVAGGRPIAWLEARVVRQPRHGDRLDHHPGIDGAETVRTFATRVYRSMDRVLASDCPTQVIITHGFALTFVVAAWIGMPLESTGWVNFRSSPGGLTHLHEDDRFFNRAVLSLNDVAHLDGL
jgi:probable phosphoglycerate mutase